MRRSWSCRCRFSQYTILQTLVNRASEIQGSDLVYLCQGSIAPDKDGKPDLDAKAIVQVSSEAGSEIVVHAEHYTSFYAKNFKDYDRILDDPEIGVFDEGKLWENVIIGVIIVVVISAVTFGVGAAAFGLAGCSLLLLGGSVLGTGLYYVGRQAFSDYRQGVVSDWSQYAMAAIVGCAVGFINGVAPFVPAIGTSFLTSVGTAFVTGTLTNVLDQALAGGDIDWGSALMAGGFSALLAAALFAVCFVAGTPVLTEKGTVAIEDVKVGDLVWSENPATGEKGLKRVLRTFVNRASEIVHVRIGEETVSCTPGHPFWVVGKGWIGASQLVSGDELTLQSGDVAVVQDALCNNLIESVAVYNFLIEDWHTYYVGEIGMLVHNLCVDAVNPKGDSYPSVIDPRTGENIPLPSDDLVKVPSNQQVIWDSTQRGLYIKEWYDNGFATPAGGWENYDIHHIVPREYGGGNDFWNLVPVERTIHQQQFNPWWTAYR